MASIEVRQSQTQHYLKVSQKASLHAKSHHYRTAGSWVIVSVVQKTGLLRPPFKEHFVLLKFCSFGIHWTILYYFVFGYKQLWGLQTCSILDLKEFERSLKTPHSKDQHHNIRINFGLNRKSFQSFDVNFANFLFSKITSFHWSFVSKHSMLLN